MTASEFHAYMDLDWYREAVPNLRDAIKSLLLQDMTIPNDYVKFMKKKYPSANAAFETEIIKRAYEMADDIVCAAIVMIGKRRFNIIDVKTDTSDITELKALLKYVIDKNVHIDISSDDIDLKHIIVDGVNASLSIICYDEAVAIESKGEERNDC
ncbi:MAG: hypothetical protein VZR64_00400 [Eubacterium sp.]|nr:hypothetical protein [Eubacterium sp.]